MDVGKLGPGDGDHLGRGVQLHRARAKADHRRVERQVLVLQALQVSQHLGLLAYKEERKKNKKKMQRGVGER